MFKKILPFILAFSLILFVFPVSADVIPDYPFPNCSNLVRDKEYLIVHNEGVSVPNLPSGYWALYVWSKGESRIFQEPNTSPGKNGRIAYLLDGSTITGDFAPTDLNPIPMDTFYTRYIWDGSSSSWVSDQHWNVIRMDFLNYEYYSSMPIRWVSNSTHGGGTENFFPLNLSMQFTSWEVLREVAFLIPYLVLFLIGFLGFYKGWRLLLRLLRRA